MLASGFRIKASGGLCATEDDIALKLRMEDATLGGREAASPLAAS